MNRRMFPNRFRRLGTCVSTFKWLTWVTECTTGSPLCTVPVCTLIYFFPVPVKKTKCRFNHTKCTLRNGAFHPPQTTVLDDGDFSTLVLAVRGTPWVQNRLALRLLLYSSPCTTSPVIYRKDATCSSSISLLSLQRYSLFGEETKN